MDFKPIEFTGEMRVKYWDGRTNLLVRYWTYLREGLNLINESKNYLLLVFGSFWTAKVITIAGYTINPNWTILAGVLGIPTLTLLGRWNLYKANKPREYLVTNETTVTGYGAYNMSVRQVEQNDEIITLLKNINSKLDNVATWEDVR